MSPPHLISLVALAMVSAAHGVVVNIDFSALPTSADRYSGEAAAPDPAGSDALWNNIVEAAGSHSVSGLEDSAGDTTTWDITLSGFLNTRKSASEQEVQDVWPGAASYKRLMEDYLLLDSGANSSVTTATGQIAGLRAGWSYDLYFYGQGSDMIGTDASSSGENSLFTVNSISQQTGWDGVEGGDRKLAEGIEYVKFTTVADGNGRINFTWSNVVAGVNAETDKVVSNTNSGSRYAALNGMQIVEGVPEPSTALLAIPGLAGLTLRRRRT